MNKTTEALKLAEALENDAKEHREVSYGLDCPPERTANWKHALNCEAAARLIREALAEPVCEHRIADARNEFVRDGYICIKCGALFRAADHAEPVKQEPVASVVAMLDKCISIIGTEMVRCKQAGDKWFMCQRFIHAIQDMQYEFKRDYAAPVSAPEQEPVAIVTTRFSDNYLAWDKAIPLAGTKLYAAPVSVEVIIEAHNKQFQSYVDQEDILWANERV